MSQQDRDIARVVVRNDDVEKAVSVEVGHCDFGGPSSDRVGAACVEDAGAAVAQDDDPAAEGAHGDQVDVTVAFETLKSATRMDPGYGPAR